jgi:predicted acyl esterase
VTEGRLRATLRAEHAPPYALPAGVTWHRSQAEDVLPLKAGEPVLLHFDMMPTSWLFQPGHRLQIAVTGADHREKNRPASLGPRFRVLADEKHPSTITLPVIPDQPGV